MQFEQLTFEELSFKKMPFEKITSAQNPKIKTLLSLEEKSKFRRESGLFTVEGRRELEHCLAAGYQADTIFICPEIFETCSSRHPETFGVGDSRQTKINENDASRHCEVGVTTVVAILTEEYPRIMQTLDGGKCKVFEVSREVYAKVAYREGTEGIIAEVKCKGHSLEDLELGENPLIMVLEAVEKPGNLGAVLRSADAAGADAVVICDPLTDLYNPNLIRASIGAIFTVPVAACSSEEAVAFFKKHNIQILTAQLQDSLPYYDTDMQRGTAIVMGTEATGLTDIWRAAADAHIMIPMLGQLDSLNVSVSAAILLFEAVRQRQK